MHFQIDFSKDSDKQKLYTILKTRKPKVYDVEIKERKNIRSNKQNNYYWGVLIPILSKDLGWFEDEIHEYLKKKFNRKEKVLPSSEIVEIGGSTKDLNTADAENYYNQIRIWALTECDIFLPLPNE